MNDRKSRVGNRHRNGGPVRRVADTGLAMAMIVQGLRRTVRMYRNDHLQSEFAGVRCCAFAKEHDPREMLQWDRACRMLGEYRLKQRGGE